MVFEITRTDIHCLYAVPNDDFAPDHCQDADEYWFLSDVTNPN